MKISASPWQWILKRVPPALRSCNCPDTFRRHLETHYNQQTSSSPRYLPPSASDSTFADNLYVYKFHVFACLFTSYLHVLFISFIEPLLSFIIPSLCHSRMKTQLFLGSSRRYLSLNCFHQLSLSSAHQFSF